MVRLRVVAGTLGLWLAGALCWAEDTPEAPPFSESMGASLARAGFALLFVIALILLTVWVIKKYFPQLAGTGTLTGKVKESYGENIEIVDVKGIANKRYLVLVRIRDREVLIGSTEDGLTPLDSWSLRTGDKSASDLRNRGDFDKTPSA